MAAAAAAAALPGGDGPPPRLPSAVVARSRHRATGGTAGPRKERPPFPTPPAPPSPHVMDTGAAAAPPPRPHRCRWAAQRRQQRRPSAALRALLATRPSAAATVRAARLHPRPVRLCPCPSWARWPRPWTATEPAVRCRRVPAHATVAAATAGAEGWFFKCGASGRFAAHSPTPPLCWPRALTLCFSPCCVVCGVV
jgi:hypothetical protein